MAGPITWRNVGATTSSAGVGGLLQGAQASFDQGIGALDKVLQQAKTTQQANWDQGKENNTNQVMNGAMAIQDPEELARAQATGQFQQMMAGMGAQVDQAAVRNFLDTRGGVLQERAIANQEYQDQNTRVGQRELEAQIYQRAYAGDIQGAQALAGQLQIDQRDHLAGVTTIRREFDADQREDTRLAYVGQRAANDGARLALQRAETDARMTESTRIQNLNRITSEFFTGLQENPEVPVAVAQRGLADALSEAGGNLDEIAQFTQQLDATKLIMDSPGQADQALYDRGIAALQAPVQNNVFFQAAQNQEAGDVVAERVQGWAREDGQVGQAGRVLAGERDTAIAITDIINNGLDYRLPDGERVRIPVSESMIKNAVRNIAPTIGFRTSDIRELLRMEIEAGNYADQLMDYRQYRDIENQFKADYQESISRRN